MHVCRTASKGVKTLPSDPIAEGGRFQSGLLALGALHTRYGHVSRALMALQETIRLAQQHHDAPILAHALAALCR